MNRKQIVVSWITVFVLLCSVAVIPLDDDGFHPLLSLPRPWVCVTTDLSLLWAYLLPIYLLAVWAVSDGASQLLPAQRRIASIGASVLAATLLFLPNHDHTLEFLTARMGHQSTDLFPAAALLYSELFVIALLLYLKCPNNIPVPAAWKRTLGTGLLGIFLSPVVAYILLIYMKVPEDSERPFVLEIIILLIIVLMTARGIIFRTPAKSTPDAHGPERCDEA